MKKGKLLLRFITMILVISLVIPIILQLSTVTSYASYKSQYEDSYIYDDIQGSLSVTYRVYGDFYEESYGGLNAKGHMDTTETVKVPITVSVSRTYRPSSSYTDTRYKYTYDIKAQYVNGNWSAQDYTVAPGLDHDSGSWVLASGSVTASVPRISQWEGQYASTDYGKSIPISEKINTDGVSMSVSSFKDMNPDWFVKDEWYSLNVKVLKANVEFEIPAFKQLTVKWDDGVDTVYDYWSQHNHSDLGELVNGGKYFYQKGDRAYTFINLKEGYDFDYIGEGSNDHHWTDTKWNDTKKRWENSWSMANDREIYIHTKKQIKTLNLSWDSGVNMVIGHSTEGSDMQMPNGGDVGYYYGTTAPAWIYLNDGYDIDYIEDLDSGEKIYVSSSDWNEDNSRYDKYFEMKQNRKLKIHTKLNTYTLTIDPNYGTMYNGSEETSSKFTTKFVYGRKTYIGNSYTDKYGYLDYENNTPTRTGYTFAGWKFSNGTGGLNSDGSEFFFGEIAADEDTTYDDDDIYIFNGDYTGDVTATAQWTKRSYQQDVYVRYQNEDGSWGDYSDKYWHISTDESPNGYWEYFRWSIDNGSSFWFGLEDIKQDSKWDDTLYEFPDTFADGSSLSYTVTGESNKYVDIKRKQYTMNFNKGLTDSTATMPDVEKSAGDSYEIPLPKWLGRSYVITLDNDGSKTTISGNLTFDQWEGYKNIPFSEIKKDDARYDWYSDGDLLENIRSNMTFVANWNSENITLPTPTKSGYIFDGWYEDEAFTKKVNSTTYEVEPDTTALNVTLYAKWTAQTASYTVKHHYMDVNGKYSDGTGLLETENLTAQVGSSVTPNTKARTGFTTPSTQSVIVKADGTTVVDYYYTRNKYKVTLTKDDNIDTTTGNGDYYYGASVTVKATVKANTKQYTYNWNKWESSNTNILANSTNKDYTFTMPANNVTLKATGSNTVNSYKITVNRIEIL